jgi:N-acetyl-anhydromuramyl-L-alanine amidase AmpD
MNLRQIGFSDYFQEVHPKSQIYLHHTAGAAEGERQFGFWSQDKVKVATCVCISRDGEIVQGFGSKYWAYHLGLATSHFSNMGLPYKNLDKISIGVEICNWGWLTERSGEFYTYVGSKVPKERVIALDKPYRGHTYWEAYTDAQIASVAELLVLWRDRYSIPVGYDEGIWGIHKGALSGLPGVYTHNSVRPDKTDVYPHPGLIDMLKKL